MVFQNNAFEKNARSHANNSAGPSPHGVALYEVPAAKQWGGGGYAGLAATAALPGLSVLCTIIGSLIGGGRKLNITTQGANDPGEGQVKR